MHAVVEILLSYFETGIYGQLNFFLLLLKLYSMLQRSFVLDVLTLMVMGSDLIARLFIMLIFPLASNEPTPHSFSHACHPNPALWQHQTIVRQRFKLGYVRGIRTRTHTQKHAHQSLFVSLREHKQHVQL